MEPSPFTTTKTPKADTRWLLSLADLVTLLLAVTAVSLTAGNLDIVSQADGGARTGRTGVGINLALSQEETLSRTVYLFEDQFVEEGQALSNDAANYLKWPKNYREGSRSRVEVMSCSPSKSDEAWHTSLLRLLTLHRHLFDGNGGLEERKVTMTSLGNHCELLGFAGESGKVPVMAVRFREETEVKDG